MKRLIAVLSILIGVSMLLGACAPAATPAPTAMPAPTTAPAAPAATTAPAATAGPTATAGPNTAVPTDLPRNQTLFISGAAWGPASTWNPFQTGNLANTTGTVGLVYETLFGFDPLSGQLIPWLAASGTWTNPTTYDLVLRDGLTWSDGQPLTADDVVYTFTIAKTNTALWTNALYSAYGLTGVTSSDANSRGIHLHQPGLPVLDQCPL